MTQHASTAVKMAALALAAPALLLPMKAAGQQVAANTGPNFAACDQIKDPARSAQCYADADLAHSRARIKAADERIKASDDRVRVANQQIAEAKDDTTCANDITAMRSANPEATKIGRDIIQASGRPAAEYGICRLRDAIRAGLAAKR